MKILIMAGGIGERFWPLSRPDKPKQFLHLITNKSMIQETVDRLENLVNRSDIYIATNESQADLLIASLDNISKENIIIEPAFKDTAAAIAYGSTIIARNSKIDDVIVVLASDHVINNRDMFIKTLEIAEKEAKKGFIVTLGIIPNSPKTCYGYIKVNDKLENKPTTVLEFTEKPDLETAKKYLTSDNYLWNSGMFIFKYEIIMKEIEKYIPKHFNTILKIKSNMANESGIDLANISRNYFNEFEKISIDYAIMEKSKIVKCIPVNIGWNDVGSFESLSEVFPEDCKRNIIKNCKYVYLDSSDNIVISDEKERLVTTIGVKNMVIVITDDAILICDRNQSQRIKELLKKI